ncbi:MAG: formyltransferase family protein [Prolixibacteraceae bacterium]
MRTGIISDSDSLIPLVYTLAAQKLQVYLFYSASQDAFTNQSVREFAGQNHIPMTEERNKDHDLYAWLNKGAFDICFVIGYRYLIKLNKISRPIPVFNIHFGPLPSFRGPVPLFWQLKRGVEKIGLTIHRLTERFDDGPVVWMKEVNNQPHYNYKLVSRLFSQLCVEGVFFILRLMMAGLPVPVIDRSSIVPAYQKRPGLNDVKINWQQMDALAICNLVRACNPWNKGAICFFKNQEVKLMDAGLINPKENQTGADAGSIVDDNECLRICCKDGKNLTVNMLFFQDSFVPAYQAKCLGFQRGDRFTE